MWYNKNMRINDITRTIYRVKDFFDWQKSNKLEMSPSFQRRPVWKPSAKSFLIDSIVRNYPIPPILLRERTLGLKELESKYEVVDGQQRLRTILSFIDPKLFSDNNDSDNFLVKSYHNKDISDKKFSSLSPEVRRQILDYQLIVHVLPSTTEDSEILEIFSRINSTGVRLNGQELRNAEYSGEFKTSMYILAAEQLFRWRNWKVFQESRISRMEEIQLTSELVMLIINGITTQNQSSLNAIYLEYDNKFSNRKEIEKRFRYVMDEIDKKIGHIFKEGIFSGKILFYPLFAAFYNNIYGLQSSVKKGLSPKNVSQLWVSNLITKGTNLNNGEAPASVLKSLAGQTNNVENRKIIYNYLASK